MSTRGDRLRARAAKSDKNRAVFNAAKKVGNRSKASEMLNRNGLANRKVQRQLRSGVTGQARKGNLGGKTQVIAGLIAGKTTYKFTQARKNALDKARKARR